MPVRSETWRDLKRLFNELPPSRVYFLVLVLTASILQGMMDILLVGLLARLVGVLAGVRLADQLPGIRVFGGDMFDQTGWLIALLIAAFWFTSGLRFGVAYLQSILSAEIWNDLVNKVYRNLMLQNYEFFTHQRTANLSESFNRILNNVSTNVVSPIITIASNALSVVVLLLGVVFVLGAPALIMFVLILAAYVLASKLTIPYLRFAIKQRLRYSRRIHLLLMESLRSMRDVHLYSADGFFVNRFASDGVIAKRNDRLAKLLPDIPRYVIEPAGITILFFIGLGPSILAGDASNVRDSIPTLAAILGTLLRISAPLQKTFLNINKLRGGLPEIQDALELLDLLPQRIDPSSSLVPTSRGVMPRQFIQLRQVSFRYTSSNQNVLKSIDMTIPIGSRVALVGRTGSGKTTLAHLILGLFRPTDGVLTLDGVPLTDIEMPAWQANCALVPQDIQLLDASIRENVAFGCDSEDIDDSQVWAALEASQFNDVVVSMPYGLFTMIGENGVELSGGQRQRLSLARAFYRDAKVLVLDEATSALDSKTEHDVMQALDLVGRRCTTIVIAHRLSTVRKCDRIFEVENGRIKAVGDFESLCRQSESFLEMTQFEGV